MGVGSHLLQYLAKILQWTTWRIYNNCSLDTAFAPKKEIMFMYEAILCPFYEKMLKYLSNYSVSVLFCILGSFVKVKYENQVLTKSHARVVL